MSGEIKILIIESLCLDKTIPLDLQNAELP